MSWAIQMIGLNAFHFLLRFFLWKCLFYPPFEMGLKC